MYKKYYSYNDMPVPVKNDKPKIQEHREQKDSAAHLPQTHAVHKENSHISGGLLENIKTDDIILIAVILALLLDGCEDKLLIAAIAFVLLTT